MGASAVASEPNAAADAAGATGAAVAGGGKAAFWSRNNAKFALSGVAVAAPQWNAEVNADDSRLAFTPEEQQELVQHLRGALERLVALPAVPLQVEPADGSVPVASEPATAAEAVGGCGCGCGCGSTGGWASKRRRSSSRAGRRRRAKLACCCGRWATRFM